MVQAFPSCTATEIPLATMILKQKNIPNFVKTNLLPLLVNYNIITFIGPLGAGKTTIIREILRQAGVTAPVTSPTFGYVKSYVGGNNHFYHFDLYRINNSDAFIDAGFDEYFTQKDSTCLIEWPEVIAPVLANKNIVTIAIDYDPIDQLSRNITISK